MKALLALEPFHQDSTRLRGMHHTLALLTGSPANVEVGFVVTHTETYLNLAFDVAESDRFGVYPRQLISQEFKKAGIKHDTKKVHVVDYSTMSSTKAVDRMLEVAANRKAEVVGLFTHARKGFSRFAIGSYAETAIHRSKLSLLIFNPKTRSASRIKNILFASDFSAASKTHLKTVVAYCKKLGSRLTVFHHTEMIYAWSLDESNPQVRAYRTKVDRMKRWIEQESLRAGVPCNVILACEFAATADLILTCAKKKNINLVIVSAKVGSMAALMGGSVTRQVVRGSEVPVLVLK